MEQFVEFVVKSLVEDKDAVKVAIEKGNNENVIYVTVADDDLGRIIGKNGRIAQSIRTLVKSIASREKTKYFVKIGDR